MKKKVFDNYDYTEAYKIQQERLEEFEIEQRIKNGTKAIAYRTTTYKTVNIKNGKEIIEVNIYPVFSCKKDAPRTKRQRETKQAQKNLNDKNARRKLMRIVNTNFAEGDYWLTYGWDKNNMPGNEKQAQKDVSNFLRKVNYKRKKDYEKLEKELVKIKARIKKYRNDSEMLEDLEKEYKRTKEKMKEKEGKAKYIYVLAYTGEARPHFHMIIDGMGIDRDELEAMWDKCKRKQTRRIETDDEILSGMGNYIAGNQHGNKRWVSSKNLVQPKEPTRSYTKFTKRQAEKFARNIEIEYTMEKVYKGFKFRRSEALTNNINTEFYIYAVLTKEGVKENEDGKYEKV